MIYSKGQFCVLANPKCGSSSIQKAVVDYCSHEIEINNTTLDSSPEKWASPSYNHVGARYLSPAIDDWNSIYSLATIRNPYARMVSWHAWYRLKNNKKTPFKKWIKSYWLSSVREKKFAPPSIRHFAFDKEGRQLVTEILRIEDLSQEWPRIAKLLSLKNDKPLHLNRTEHRPYITYYDKSSRQIVERFFKKDLILGDYSF
tara:strand:+ start:3080 stop:3682 length:603 start_codon:yes stop_codon:yes gene_type:complete